MIFDGGHADDLGASHGVSESARDAQSATCGFTVLRVTGSRQATKEYRWEREQWRKLDYSAGSFFEPQAVRFAGIDGLGAAIERIRRDSKAFIVRGELTEVAHATIREARGQRQPPVIRRRKLIRGDQEATLREVDRRWLMADVDNWPIPAWGDLADDPVLVIEHAIRELFPPCFHDVRCFWQLSSSAGFKPGLLKVHLFFWLSAPASNELIKRSLAEHAPGVDRAPFQAAQPHFIADPIITGGHDPLPRRTGWIEGTEEEVELPAPTYRESGRPFATGTLPAGDVLDALAFLGHSDGDTHRAGFHEPLRTATWRYARQCVRYGKRDDDALIEQLRAAVRTAPVRAGVTSAELEHYCSDHYLRPMIAGAFERVRTGDGDFASVAPEHEAPTGDAATARAELDHILEDAFARYRAHHVRGADEPPHEVVAAMVGLGKSTAVRRLLVRHVQHAKAAGTPHRTGYFVPHHKLSNELVRDMAADRIDAAVQRGRDADNPDAPGEKMCLNIARVEEAIKVGAEVEKAVCGTPADPNACSFNRDGTCAWQRQKGPVSQADVVIAANTFLFHKAPAAALNDDTGLIIADEGFWQQGLVHTEVDLSTFAHAVLVDPVLTQGKLQRINAPDTDALLTWGKQLAAALTGSISGDGITPASGRLATKQAILDAGLTLDDCITARKLEWSRKRKNVVRLGLTDAQWKEGIRRGAVNATLARRAGLWTAVIELLEGQDEATGRIELGVGHNGNPAAFLNLRREIREEIAALPILALDATAPMPLIQQYLPRARLLADIQAHAPHASVVQVLGGWGKTSLLQSDKVDRAENTRRDQRIEEVADFVRLHGGGNAAVITYEGLEERFRDLPGVQAGHFGAITGLNAMSDVEHLFIIGRPLANPSEQLAQARALTGRPIAPETPHRATRGVRLADGTGAAINVRAYHDPDLEAVRCAVTDAEVLQAIGRGRAINRTAEKPLTVWLMADIVTPLPVDHLVRWEDVRLSDYGRMLARGVALRSATDAAAAFPWLFSTAKSAQRAFDRMGDFSPIPLWKPSYRGKGQKYLREVSYRPSGRGQQTRRALVLPNFLNDCREWLEEHVGELALFDIEPTAEPVETPQPGTAAHQTPPPRPANDQAGPQGARPQAPASAGHGATARALEPVWEWDG